MGPIGGPIKLTVKFVESVSEAGKYYDSYGLILHVRASGAKKWLQRFTFNGRRLGRCLSPFNLKYREMLTDLG